MRCKNATCACISEAESGVDSGTGAVLTVGTGGEALEGAEGSAGSIVSRLSISGSPGRSPTILVSAEVSAGCVKRWLSI